MVKVIKYKIWLEIREGHLLFFVHHIIYQSPNLLVN